MKHNRKLSRFNKVVVLFTLRLPILLAGFGVAASVWTGTRLPGDYRFELEAGDRTRSYWVHVPPQAVSGPLPVIISLHGGGGNARQHRLS